MIVLASNLKFNDEKSPQYFKEFVSFYDTWKLINILRRYKKFQVLLSC